MDPQPSPAAPIRVIVVDDDPIVRSALISYVEASPTIEVVSKRSSACLSPHHTDWL